MEFKAWFETHKAKDFNYFKDIILNYLNLDPQKGLSQNIDSMNRENLKRRLQGLGEFVNLPVNSQQQVLNVVDNSPSATIGDLIRLMVS